MMRDVLVVEGVVEVRGGEEAVGDEDAGVEEKASSVARYQVGMSTPRMVCGGDG